MTDERPTYRSFAQFCTTGAATYMQKLCMHFGRKVQSKCGPDHAWVDFGFGRCEMTARARSLDFATSAATADDLGRVISVITSHLERYAFRENPRLDWQLTPSSSNQETHPCKDAPF